MNQPLEALVNELRAIPGYRELFQNAYVNEPISASTVAKAIATFERAVVSSQAPFDQWMAGDEVAISDAAKRGFVLFNTKARCSQCHVFTTKVSIAEHSQALLQATQVKGLAVTSLSLLLTQQEVTKSMLLNPDNVIEAPRKIRAHDENIATLETMKSLAVSSTMITLVQQLTEMDERELTPLDTTILETLGGGQAEAAQALYFSTYEPKRMQYEAVVRQLGDIAEADVQAAAARVAASSHRAVIWIYVTLGVGITITIGASWCIARRMVRPLRQMVSRLKDIAEGEGDLTQRVEIQRSDELGELGKWFNVFMDKLHNIIGQVQTTAKQISTASHEFSEVTGQFSSGAQHQAASLEETVVSLEHITSAVERNATSAHQASQLAIESQDAAEQGGQVVMATVTAMSEISTSSKQIVDIIAVIDALAFQTNLLALNAAVEAARAGEQGRGFAVVATEVRKLAQRSAMAAQEIKTLIQDAGQKVERGVALVNRSGQALEDIVREVKRVSAIIAEIAATSQEQSTGLAQVNNTMTQMDRVTQASVGQTAHVTVTVQALTRQAESLQALVGQFKLHKEIPRQERRSQASTRPSGQRRLHSLKTVC